MSAQPKDKKQINPFVDLELRSLRDYVMIIRERWILAASCALLLACLLGFYLINRPAVFEASASLLLERQGERIVDMQQVVDTGLEGSGGLWSVTLQNHIQQINSRSFQQYVIATLTDAERRQIVAPYLPDDPAKQPPSVAAVLGGKVSVENLRNTFVLQIKARHQDPQSAALIANCYAEGYVHFILARSSSGNETAVAFLTDQAEALRQRLEDSERLLQEYRQKHHVVSLEENQNIIVQRLKDVSSAVTSARVERLGTEARLNQVEKFQREGRDLLEISFISRFGSIPHLLQELDQLSAQREVMGERYAHRHSRMMENERAIAAAENLIRENVQMAVADLQSEMHRARQREDKLQAELRESERESMNLDKLTIQYNVLRRKVEGNRATHSQIIDRLNETNITSQIDNTSVKIVDQAVPSGAPIEPNVRKALMVVILLGAFTFVGVPLGWEFLDNKLKTAWDIEHFLGQKLLAEIPLVAKIEGEDLAHVVSRTLNDNVSESFRALVSQVHLSSARDFPKTLLMTSTIPGEGKSFIVSNHSCCQAAHGKRVLMIDCDFRRPGLHRAYGLRNDAGILHWLAMGGELLEDLLTDESLGISEVAPGTFLLRSGGHTKQATETISNPKVNALVAALKKKFDLLVMDTPPLGVFPDALSLARLADEVLFVTRFGQVNRQQVKKLIESLEETDAELLGIVLNGLPPCHSSYSYYSYGSVSPVKYYAQKE